ncbi:MAG TPA: translation initiation factor IF-2 [Thermoanaerobaculia bacterium]
MAKIRVHDLARMMQIPEQDLVFKLRSLGVRVEGDDAGIEAEALQAILQGKRLASPREVIMDDGPAPAPPPSRGTGGESAGATGRRQSVNPLRPSRPRTIIQKVEPRILTLPMTQPDRPAPTGGPVAGVEHAPVTLEAAPPAAPPSALPPSPPAAPAPVASTPTPVPAAPPTAAPVRRGAILIHRPTEPYRPAPPPRGRPGAPPGRPGPGRPSGLRPPTPGYGRPAGPGRPGGFRPGASPPPPPGVGRGPRKPGGAASDRDRAKKKKRRTTPVAAQDGTNLRALRGSLEDIEQVVDEAVVPSGSAHRRRRRGGDELEVFDLTATLKPTRTAEDGPVVISEGMTVREFAEKLGVRVKDMIRILFDRGILGNINHVIDAELSQQIARELGLEAKVMTFEEEIQSSHRVDEVAETDVGKLVPRAPVVTIMGHVDHGKTSLLDKIRSSKIAEGESGGITQHIGAYHVDVKDRQIVFLDTPGHEAFTLMRARGAKATDVVILVVAADDGVMPQTLEAIDHSRAAGVPMVVALNKIDKANAAPDRVKQQLADAGLLPEDWGGSTVVVPVSALRGDGIDELLEMVLLSADLLELKADPERPAQGVVLEARKETGRGVVATVLVQNGTLKVGDIFVTGATWGRVRSMADDRGRRAQESGPATAVEVTGFQDVPEAGDSFQVVDNEQKARGIVEFRQLEQRKRDLAPAAGRLSLEQLFSQIEKGEVKELGVVLKADVQGSVEVLRDAIEKLSTSKVRVRVLHSAVGAVSTNDVLLAAASRAIVVGFNIRPEKNASELAEKEQIEIRLYTVIYELLDELKMAMTGLLEPTFKEVQRGRAEVREIFKVPKIGTIAGCHVIEGVIPRSSSVRLLRDNRVIHEGKISSLKRFKDDASEVRSGFDCGIGLERFQDLKPGDIIEAFVKEEVAAVLV